MSPSKAFITLLCASALAGQTRETVKVVSRQLERTGQLPGEFLPYQSVAIYARVPGFVDKVLVDRGSIVKKGDLLATLVAPEMEAKVAEAESKVQTIEAQRAEAEANLLGAESTWQHLKAASATPGAIAGNELILAEKAVDAGRALLKAQEGAKAAAISSVQALKELLGYLNVVAPFDGGITERLVHPGALAGPGAGSAGGPLMTLEQTAMLRLVVAVPETAVSGIVRGARISFTVPAYPGRAFSGTVARIPRSMDPATRTMPVELDVPNSKGLLAPGMYPDVKWPVRPGRASLLVPRTSIVVTTERTFVVRSKEGRAEWVDVRRGASAGDFVEVFGALRAGDEIVQRGSDEIREGAAL